MSFLLTDIEASTTHWERSGAAFGPALAQHHALTRRELTHHGGRELTEAGDGFLIAFHEPEAAALCAIALQNALAHTTWPPGVSAVKVRMALHTGLVEPLDDGEFRGPALNRAARLRDGAHGGQVVVSEPFRSALPAAFAVRELGAFRLRGVADPERVFQLCWPEMPEADFPGLKLPPAFQANLPHVVTRFFGRETEISRLRELLIHPDGARLVTLTGPGGTGKTRLSLAVAESVLEAFSHAVWFVPLADLDSADQLPLAIRAALRLPPDPAREALAQIIELLGAQPCLLILDNFEQLGPEGAALIQTLRRRAPSLVCLITSRQRLGLAGEREFSLHPLAVPAVEAGAELAACASVQLFVDRAVAVRSDFALTPGNSPPVAELCRKLEGVPLALELAAARAQVVTPREMVRQLGQRLDYFASHDPLTPARHRTLRAAIDWSYDFLPPALREFFANLAVFRGGWDADAARAVAAVTGLGSSTSNVLHALGELRGSSLLLAEDGGETMRFRMLETLRQYAGERLSASPHEEAVRQRHVRYFYELTDHAQAGLFGTEQTQWLDRLEAEHDNLRAALAFADGTSDALQIAADLPYFWMTRGYLEEGRKVLDRLLASTKNPTPKLLSGAQNAAGILALTAADYAAAQAHFQQALQIVRRLEDPRNVAALLANVGCVAQRLRDYTACRAAYEEALALYDTLHMEQPRAQVLGNLGGAAVDQRDPKARAWLEESLEISRGLGDRFTMANALHNLGELARQEARLEEALKYFEEDLELRQSLRDQNHAGAALCALGCVAVEAGQTEAGIRWLAATEFVARAFKTKPTPEDAADATQALNTARQGVPTARFAELWQEGEKLGAEKLFPFQPKF